MHLSKKKKHLTLAVPHPPAPNTYLYGSSAVPSPFLLSQATLRAVGNIAYCCCQSNLEVEWEHGQAKLWASMDAHSMSKEHARMCAPNSTRVALGVHTGDEERTVLAGYSKKVDNRPLYEIQLHRAYKYSLS